MQENLLLFLAVHPAILLVMSFGLVFEDYLNHSARPLYIQGYIDKPLNASPSQGRHPERAQIH